MYRVRRIWPNMASNSIKLTESESASSIFASAIRWTWKFIITHGSESSSTMIRNNIKRACTYATKIWTWIRTPNTTINPHNDYALSKVGGCFFSTILYLTCRTHAAIIFGRRCDQSWWANSSQDTAPGWPNGRCFHMDVNDILLPHPAGANESSKRPLKCTRGLRGGNLCTFFFSQGCFRNVRASFCCSLE